MHGLETPLYLFEAKTFNDESLVLRRKKLLTIRTSHVCDGHEEPTEKLHLVNAIGYARIIKKNNDNNNNSNNM